MSFLTEQLAIEAIKAEAREQGWVDFDGQNCNDYLGDDEPECMGWDGEDNRCDCGNRRVYITTSQEPGGMWYAYAVAN